MFVTHKHIDHLLGVIWMMRRILGVRIEKQFDIVNGKAYHVDPGEQGSSGASSSISVRDSIHI